MTDVAGASLHVRFITLSTTPKKLKTNYIRISLIVPILFLLSLDFFGQPSETTYLGTTIKEGAANDLSYGPFEIGFSFNFYGVPYTQFYVSSNGLVTFGSGSSSNAETTIPSVTLPDNFIAPFWDDLKIDGFGSILFSTIGGVNNRKLIIQFRNMGFYPSPIYMGTFTVILYETSNKIQCQYRMIVLQDVPKAKGGDASIGIENADGSAGIQYAFHNPAAVASWKAISFTPSGNSYTLNGDALYDGVYLTRNLTLPEPGITDLIVPSNASTVGTEVTFRWGPSDYATTYYLRMANNPEMTGAATYYSGPGLTHTVTGLIDGTTYYWTVMSSNATGFTWNEVKKFRVSTAPPLTAVPQTIWAEQNLDKIIKLDYTGGDASPKTAIVTSIPLQGQLFQYNAGNKGAQITTLPGNITDPGRNVIYSASGASGNGVGNFNFKMNDAGGDSPEAVITVNVSPPGIPYVLYTAKGSGIEIQFDRIMNDPTGRQNQFQALVNGSPATISAASLKEGDPYTIVLTLTPALTGTETVLVSYTQGDVTSSSGGFLLSFSDQPVTLLSQAISFTQSLNKTLNESPFALSATASSGLGITYSSSTLSVAEISSNIVTLRSTGTSVITARQSGNSVYAPAKFQRVLVVMDAQFKILNIKLLLESLHNGSGGMVKVQNSVDGESSFSLFPGTIVDTLTIKVAETSDPYRIVYLGKGIALNIDGTISIGSFPANLSGNYYIIVNHRNHIETWSQIVSFSGSIINYDFTDAITKAWGNNMVLSNGHYCIFSGDVNNDEYVDGFDIVQVFNLNKQGSFGYQSSDMNGDGFVDGFDLVKVFNNNKKGVGMNTPIAPM